MAKSFLRLIPVSVLFGLLLHFGVVSFSGTQLYDRILYLFMPLKNTPNWSYARGVRVIKRNFYTLIQIFSVAILMVFKSVAVVSFFFPIFLVLLVCLRKFLLPKFYTDRELEQVKLNKVWLGFKISWINFFLFFLVGWWRGTNKWPWYHTRFLWAYTFTFINMKLLVRKLYRT